MKLNIKLTHKITMATAKRNDIIVEFENSGIFNQTICGYISDTAKIPQEPAVSVAQTIGEGKTTHISIPIDEVEHFCDKLILFANKMRQLLKDTTK